MLGPITYDGDSIYKSLRKEIAFGGGLSWVREDSETPFCSHFWSFGMVNLRFVTGGQIHPLGAVKIAKDVQE